MNALPLSLSLSSSFTEVGAIAAFAALLGIAILSLLAFAQAREIKRLREWAGRAPERTAELEQRVSADAAVRVQRTAAPVAPARAVPRKTPLVSAPVSTAVNATAAAAVPGMGNRPVPGLPAPASPTLAPASGPQADEGTPATASDAPVAGDGEGNSVTGEHAAPTVDGATGPVVEEEPAIEPTQPTGEPKEAAAEAYGAESTALAPATAAARAASVSARAPLPPSPSSPAPPGAPSSPASPHGEIPAAEPPRPGSRPPAPVAAARHTPSRVVGGEGSGVPLRSPSSLRGRSASATVGAGARTASARTPGAAADLSGPKYFKRERSPARATALIVGGAIAGAILLVFALSALFGGGGSRVTATQSSASGGGPAGSHTTGRATASKPAETAVMVLNGTSTAGLAHHLARDLQQSGYTRATALAGVPPGTHATTLVEYTHGHRADAQAVAKALNVTQVQGIDGSIASLAGSATVVVLAGADQATQLGGGGAQSKGEPAAGASGAGSGTPSGEAGAGAGTAAGAGEAPAGAAGEGTAGSGH